MDEKLATLRAAFPALDGGLCFLDWGSTGLLSQPARKEVSVYLEEASACPGADAGWMHSRHATTRQEAREAAAAMIGAQAEEIALMESATAGLNAVADAVPMRPGDRVLLSAVDYPAVWLPWKRRRRRDEVELVFVPSRDGRLEAGDVLERLDERTRVVALSTQCWTTGALVDLETIGREAALQGTLLLVDAAQTCGVVPLDVRACSTAFLATSGHKWLCSPLGAGFLFVDRQRAPKVQPRSVGLLAGRPPRGSFLDWFQDPQAGPGDDPVFPATARAFETGGTPPYPGAIGLRAALQLLLEAGPARILEHVRDLGDRLIAGLDARDLQVVTPRDRQRRAGTVVFNLPGGVEAEKAAAARLREQGIAVSVRYCNGYGGLRVCFHGMNVEADADRLLDAL